MECYAPCCWANIWSSEKNPRNTLPMEHFTGEDFNRIRKEMMAGEKTEFLKSYCNTCWKREEEFKDSPRLQFLYMLINRKHNLLSNYNLDGTMKENDARFISIGINVYGNYCNLQCYECVPDNSSSRIAVLKKLNDEETNINFNFSYEDIKTKSLKPIDRDQFKKIVDEIVSYDHKINDISIVGGEPMMMKSHFQLLDRLIESGECKNIVINTVSNMTLMTLERMKKYFDAFNYTTIQWSIDALGQRNHWLRYPTDWEKTLKNVEEIRVYLTTNGRGEISASVTPSLFNMISLKETSDWLTANGYRQWYANFVVEPKFLSPQHLPQELKEKIGPEVLEVSSQHYNQMMSDRDEEKFQSAIRYADKLDAQRGTNWRATFPEIAEYAK
jgi:disulfide oxidoreductase YuzD